MSKFLTGKELNDTIYRIIWEAKNRLVLVSPFIRFDDYFRKILQKHLNEPSLNITIIFGKNEGRVDKSLKKDDFDFLCEFPNINIIYCANLHGKYYGNEGAGVLTSINLHDHSFDNNIEFGVFAETSLLDTFKNSADKDAWNYCADIAHSGTPVYIKRPSYQKNFLSIITGKNYIKSEVLHDSTKDFYSGYGNVQDVKQRLRDFPDELEYSATKGPMPEKEMPKKEYQSEKKDSKNSKPKIGYCIRTGEEIPYDPSKPFSYEAFKEWVQYRNFDYSETYCHKTGEKSRGRNSFRHPILNDNFENTQVRDGAFNLRPAY